VEISAPWNLAKTKEQEKLLDAVLYHLAESLRIIAIWISPVLPHGAHGIFNQLNWKMELSRKEGRFSLADAEWGGLPDGHVVGKPVPLFPRIEG
jgi:methionyl-tRNA synthetase